jgi:PAS domain S-box-containing protein
LAENANVRTRGLDVAAELLASLPDPVIGCDTDGTVVYWSRAAEELYGYPAADALGRRAATLLRTRFPMPLLEITEELSDLGRWRGRLEHRCQNGRTVCVDSRWVARHDEHGARTGSFAVERELDDAPKPAPASDAQAGPSPSALLHELNNALAIIVNYGAFMAAELHAPTGASAEAMRADLHEVQTAAERAVEITRQMQADA